MTAPNVTVPYTGLSAAEARRRLGVYGPNVLVPRKPGAALKEALLAFADPMALMLAVTGAVYLFLGDRRDGLIMLAAIIPVLSVDVILEARARGALKRLASAVAPCARVLRDGVEAQVAAEDLVPGDLLLVSEGDVVHADSIVRSQANLTVDEAHLTGESEPRQKYAQADGGVPAEAAADGKLFAGSRVITGQAEAEVTATGARTSYGNLAQLVAEAPNKPTPIQRRTGQMVRWMVVGALAAATGLFFLQWARGDSLNEAFLYAVSLAMSAVGEEFVLVLALFLSLGAWRLSRSGVLIRRLASVETLGATTVICLDKTGTLTMGDYSLQAHVPLGDDLSEDALLETAALACEPLPADAMERKIVAHCTEHGMDVDALQSRWNLVFDYPFDPIGKHMSHVWKLERSGEPPRYRIAAKGALEGIIEHCAATPAEISRADAANAELASKGMRVLAVAGRIASSGESISGLRSEDETGLRLYGLLGFQDPVRPEVPAAVAQCQQAGIMLKLITGDHALTAHAVADSTGIIHDDNSIVTGDELDKMQPAQFAQAVLAASIFARTRPEQKFAIVDALVRHGEVVAMTGDGVNDAPALRRADIGVSMGIRGTEVARASADLILLRDDFADLVTTIREGRRIYANIQRAFRYLLGFKTNLVIVVLFAPIVGLPILLLPINLVWLELVVHPVSALAFEGLSAPADLMNRPPRDPAAPIISLASASRSILSGVILAVMTLALYAARLYRGESYARGAALALIVAGSLVLAWGEIAGDQPWWQVRMPRTVAFWAVVVAVAATVPAFSYFAPLANALRIAPIDLHDWGLVVLLALAATVWRALGSAPRSLAGEPLAKPE
ncbi:MAG TPA: cation-transporting P-type ATPase [Candidatus Binataceae bacterium]|nr:cation-transporting P-type ATPase [Candidatus Binataceae bacterium]